MNRRQKNDNSLFLVVIILVTKSHFRDLLSNVQTSTSSIDKDVASKMLVITGSYSHKRAALNLFIEMLI